jgi:hypothetical protein
MKHLFFLELKTFHSSVHFALKCFQYRKDMLNMVQRYTKLKNLSAPSVQMV